MNRNIKHNVSIKENMFDYKITFSSSLAIDIPINTGGKHNDNLIIRYNSSIYRSKSKILDYAKNNIFNYFVTITLDDKKCNWRDNYDEIQKKICKFFGNFKQRSDNEFRYICVAEMGKINTKRLHFHLLVYSTKIELKHIKNGLYRNQWLFDNFGANTWKKINEYNVGCALYITKYMHKSNFACDLFNRYYFCSKGLNVSKDITYIFDEKSLQDLFIYCASCGLLQVGEFCDTMIVSRDFIINYLTIKNEFEKVVFY